MVLLGLIWCNALLNELTILERYEVLVHTIGGLDPSPVQGQAEESQFSLEVGNTCSRTDSYCYDWHVISYHALPCNVHQTF